MSVLILLQGLPGSGKSTFIQENNLEPFVISLDTFRMLYDGIIAQDGQWTIRQDNPLIYKQFEECLSYRLQHKVPTIIDNTNVRSKDVSHYVELANKVGVPLFILPFDTPYSECLRRNESRPDYKVVPQIAMERIYQSLLSFTPPKNAKYITQNECITILEDVKAQQMQLFMDKQMQEEIEMD